MTERQEDNMASDKVSEWDSVQVEVAQPVTYPVDELREDVRPLRTLFEELALEIRTVLQSKGITDPLLAATLNLRYVGQRDELTVPFPLDIEDAAVCLADPLPLDTQALRQAVASFHMAHEVQYGYALRDKPVEVVMLRVYCL